MYGKTSWIIADGFMSDTKIENYVSHEAVCVLNLSESIANIKISVYFEDRESLTDFYATCERNRTNHIRLDKIENNRGEKIPKEVPYALFVESNVPIICQHSRMDVSDPNITLMTTMAY